MIGAELMPELVVGYTEYSGSKLKKGKGFLKPNFGVGPKASMPIGYLPDEPLILHPQAPLSSRDRRSPDTQIECVQQGWGTHIANKKAPD